MPSDDLDALVKRARLGQAVPAAELVSVVQRDLRVFIAGFAATPEMVEAVFAAVWDQGRRGIADAHDLAAWLAGGEAAGAPLGDLIGRMRAAARSRLREALAECDRQAVAHQDTLLHVIARSANEALQATGSEPPAFAARIAERLKQMPPAATGLIEKRYRERLGLEEIMAAQGRTVDEVAAALCTARSSIDWQFSGQLPVDPGDSRFPVQVELFIAGTIDFAERIQLGESLMDDISRAAAFERQVRLDLVLTALFAREARPQAAPAIADITFGTASQPGQLSAMNRKSAPLRAVPDRAGSDKAAGGSRSSAPVWIAVGIVAAVAAISVAVLVNRPSSAPSPASAVAAVRPATATATVGPATIGKLQRTLGIAHARGDGPLIAVDPGAALFVGQGLETNGLGSQATLSITDRGEAVLGGDTAVRFAASSPAACELIVEHGRLRMDAAAATKPFRIVGDRASIDASAAVFAVAAENGEFRVDVERGSLAITLRSGVAPVTVASGDHAVVDTRDQLTVTSGGRWFRGIALGGPGAIIAGQRWSSQREALADGLRFTIGGDPVAISGGPPAGPDAGTAAMLAGGVSGPQGRIQLSQDLPDGSYDIEAWVAGRPGGDAGELSVGERAVAKGLALGTEGWRKLGPLRTTVTGHRLTVDFRGEQQLRLAGLSIYACGPVEGGLPPTVFLAEPKEPVRVAAPGPLVITAEVYVPDGTLRAVEFYADATKIGQAAAAPYTCSWDCRVPGTYHVSARALCASGAAAATPAIAVQVGAPETPAPTLALAIGTGGVTPLAPARITVTATPAALAIAIAKIEFFASGAKIGEAAAPPFQARWENVAAGDYQMTAVATLAGGATLASLPKALSVQQAGHLPPAVAIESPLDGEELAETSRLGIRVKATAADGRKLGKVEFLVDDQKIAEATSPPFAGAWSKATPGIHRVIAVASDDLGAKSTSEAIQVVIGKPGAFVPVWGAALGGGAADIEGLHFLSRDQAVNEGLTLSAGKASAERFQATAAVEGGLASMLETSFQSDQDELRLTQELVDGIYQVCLWMAEPKAVNAHLCELEVQGLKQTQSLGRLGKGAWAKYGPYLAKVRNQQLSIVLRGKGAAPPAIAGIAIYAPAEGSFPRPLVELAFDAFKGSATPNTGLLANVAPAAVLTPKWPRLSGNVPPGGGAGSLDFGVETSPFAVDLPAAGAALRGLKSFTISAWINCRDNRQGGGGDRIVTWTQGGEGVEIAFHTDGSLGLGINAWNDQGGIPYSSAGLIPSNDRAPLENWRFVAVAYDGTAAHQQVRYFVGTPTAKAALDRAVDAARGAVGMTPIPILSIGHLPAEARAQNPNSMFHGLIDQVRIWGSVSDGSGALTAEQIAAAQGWPGRTGFRPPMSRADAVVSQGLVAWFNAGNGLTNAGDGVSRWLDQSGNGHHAIQDNPASRPHLAPSGVNGRHVLAFKEGDALELATSKELDPEAMTLMAWVLRDEFPTDGEARRWILGKNGNETTNSNFSLLTSYDRLAAYLNIGGGVEHSGELHGATPLSARVWHHLASSYDGSRLRLYVDGAAAGERALDQKRAPGGSPVIIGRRADMWGQFGGLIDEVRIYDRALAEAEIQQIEHHLRARFFTPTSASLAFNPTFVGGWEFPGAKGGLTRDQAVMHGAWPAFRLDGDFTGGGVYVGVWTTMPPADGKEIKELHLWVKSNVSQLGVRLLDATDQVHQHSVALAKTADWQELVLNIAELSVGEHWAGANDGAWHGPLKAFGLNMGPDKAANLLQPVLWLDELSAR